MLVSKALGSLWHKWRYRKKLTPLERWVVGQVSEHLPITARSILVHQIEGIRRIYRDYHSGEVLLYRWQDKRIPSFPNRQLELKWLTLFVNSQGEALKGRVRVYLVRGYLFTLHFSPPQLMQMHPDMFTVSKALFHADVMEAVETETEAGVQVETIPQPRIPDWLAQLERAYPLSDFRAPLEVKHRANRLNAIGVCLPSDYLQLLEVCDGFTVGEVAVLGLQEIYSVALPDGEYWVIAVCGGQFLTVSEGDSFPTVYYIHHESLEPRASFASFEQALRYFLLQCTANE